jgi:Probable RNA and SrmB- binding site of polymerase A
MTAMAARLPVLSAERITAELAKLICSPGPDGPVRGISVLVGNGPPTDAVTTVRSRFCLRAESVARTRLWRVASSTTWGQIPSFHPSLEALFERV